jgi:hypothetical protein
MKHSNPRQEGSAYAYVKSIIVELERVNRERVKRVCLLGRSHAGKHGAHSGPDSATKELAWRCCRLSDLTETVMRFRESSQAVEEHAQAEAPHLQENRIVYWAGAQAFSSPVLLSTGVALTRMRTIKKIAGTRKTREPNTHMNAPAAIWSLNASIPNGRSTRP